MRRHLAQASPSARRRVNRHDQWTSPRAATPAPAGCSSRDGSCSHAAGKSGPSPCAHPWSRALWRAGAQPCPPFRSMVTSLGVPRRRPQKVPSSGYESVRNGGSGGAAICRVQLVSHRRRGRRVLPGHRLRGLLPGGPEARWGMGAEPRRVHVHDRGIRRATLRSHDRRQRMRPRARGLERMLRVCPRVGRRPTAAGRGNRPLRRSRTRSVFRRVRLRAHLRQRLLPQLHPGPVRGLREPDLRGLRSVRSLPRRLRRLPVVGVFPHRTRLQ